MRRQLTEALAYPRLLVSRLTEEWESPQHNLYEATGERCRHCGPGVECCWATCLQDFRQLDDKPIEELAASLREGIRLVESLQSELHHDETTCTCETCGWIRNAEHLTEECEHHLPHVEPMAVSQLHEPSQ